MGSVTGSHFSSTSLSLPLDKTAALQLWSCYRPWLRVSTPVGVWGSKVAFKLLPGWIPSRILVVRLRFSWQAFQIKWATWNTWTSTLKIPPASVPPTIWAFVLAADQKGGTVKRSYITWNKTACAAFLVGTAELLRKTNLNLGQCVC